jgi:hypothetical protein
MGHNPKKAILMCKKIDSRGLMTFTALLKNLSLATVTTTSLMLATAPQSQALTYIDTTPSWNGSSIIDPLGEPNTATYGQTFTVPITDNILNSFSFILGPNLYDGTAPMTFAGYVAQWDGSKATGPILYTSGTQTYTGAGFTTYLFNTGNLSLTAGQKYVAFLSASKFFVGNDHLTFMADNFSNPYSGGDFVFYNNGSDFSALTANSWDYAGGDLGDAVFTATFNNNVTPVPFEFSPEQGFLLGVPLFLGLRYLKKKRAKSNNI